MLFFLSTISMQPRIHVPELVRAFGLTFYLFLCSRVKRTYDCSYMCLTLISINRIHFDVAHCLQHHRTSPSDLFILSSLFLTHPHQSSTPVRLGERGQ